MGKKRKSNRAFLVALTLGLMLLLGWGFYYWYPRIVRYPGFGIHIPPGYGIHGIDVSHYQGRINWKEVVNMNTHGIGIRFCFIKASEGISLTDDRFAGNWQNAKKAGISRGAFHYFTAGIDGALQAKKFLSIVPLEKGDLTPVVDIEEANGLSRNALVRSLSDWLRVVEQRCGKKPIIYTGANFYAQYLQGDFDDYPLWVAHYFAPLGPRISRPWQFWQHSERGRVNGIANKVDFNVFNGDQSDFDNLLLN